MNREGGGRGSEPRPRPCTMVEMSVGPPYPSGNRTATDTRTPYVAVFDGDEANQTAHFIGRWISTRNEAGPLSETVSATVPG